MNISRVEQVEHSKIKDMIIAKIDKSFKQSEKKETEHNFTKDEISKIEKRLNNIVASLNFEIEFKLYKDSKRFYVQIIDKETKKVIREIPPEQILEFITRFEKMLGILFDRRT